MNQKDYNNIKRRIMSLSSNSYPIDDLLQDTIEKLIKKGYKEENYICLCWKVANNLIIDRYRKNEKFKNIYDKEPECFADEKCDLSFQVPDQYKELYKLRFKFKMKYKEISDFTGIKMGTLKPRISKMIREIKRVNGL